MNNKKVYPVIHYKTNFQTFEQAHIAVDSGADGLFIISHEGDNLSVLNIALQIRLYYPDLDIGVNFLGWEPLESLRCVNEFSNSINMIWFDDVGISEGLSNEITLLIATAKKLIPSLKVFASVAFKYQKIDNNPSASALLAESLDLIPVTSGNSTGTAPELDKIKTMSKELTKGLGIASGMSCDNIEQFAPYLEHILVSTGVSKDFHKFDYQLLRTFIGKVRNIKNEPNS